MADEFLKLFEVRDEPCISIFLLTAVTGREALREPIHLKNLLGVAEGGSSKRFHV